MSEPQVTAASVETPATTVRAIRAAFVTITRLPAGGFPYSAAEWTAAPSHFPFVGWVIGCPLGVLCSLLMPLGGMAAAALTVGVSMLLTGAFHEDGLADTADGLGGATDRRRALEIMKDSRLGSFGAAALIIVLVARVALLARLGNSALFALPLVGCLARVGPVCLLARMPYVSAEGTARYAHLASAGKQQAWVAIGWGGIAVAVAFALGDVSFFRLVVLGVTLSLTTVLAGLYFQRRLAGVTGDVLGAAEQLGEIAALAVLAWAL